MRPSIRGREFVAVSVPNSGRRLSIGLKVFTVTLVVLVLMCAATLLTIFMASSVNKELQLLSHEYLQSYASLARANIKSLQRASDIRRLYINVRDHQDGVSNEDLQHLAEEDSADGEHELAMARQFLHNTLEHGSGIADPITLSRVDTLLGVAEEERATLAAAQTAVIKSLASGADPQSQYWLVRRLDIQREAYEKRLDNTRVELYRAVAAAAEAAQRLEQRVVVAVVAITGFAGALGLLFAAGFARSLTRPVHRLLAGTRAVQDGQLDTLVPVTSRDEIGTLTGAFNAMVAELKIKEQIKDTFGKYIDPRIVSGLMERPELTATGGDRRIMTVSFCDMKGFTSLSETLTPTNLVNVINHYLTLMSEPVRLHEGIIDKYIGDAIMAYWGPPFAHPEAQARLACLAAIEQVARLATLNAAMPELIGVKQGLPSINIRIGIATGDLVVGNIGSDVTRSYTVIGDTVNLASRLETANKQYGTRLLVSEETARLAGAAIEFREIDSIIVMGKTEPERVFEILGRAGEIDPATRELRDRFAEGLAAYRAGLWEEAHEAFCGCREIRPDDHPSLVFIHRIADLREREPAGMWNGVWALTEK
jgi:class 3 adenylate cyclase